MALSHTDRGDTSFSSLADTNTALDSATFTPTNGTLLTASGYMIVHDGGGPTDVFTISSSGFTTSTWTSSTAHGFDVGGGYSLSSAIWTATVTSSVSGKVTLTRPNRFSDVLIFLQVDEWNGHNGVGLKNSADDGLASGSTLTIGFGGTPTSTSGAVGIIGDNNGNTTGAVQPTGWSETADFGDGNTGNSVDAAWILTGAQASPQWTSLQSGTFGKTGSVLEVLEAGTTFDPPDLHPYPQLNVYRM